MSARSRWPTSGSTSSTGCREVAPRWLRKGGREAGAPNAGASSPAAPSASKPPALTAGSWPSRLTTASATRAARSPASRAADGVSLLASLAQEEDEAKIPGPRADHGDPCGDPPLRAAR